MMKIICMILITILSNVRMDYGKCYNCCYIVTEDGNEWMLEEEEQRVLVLFNTKGTLNKEDDEIIYMGVK